ncbi:MAG TPA: hypothetical protein VFQ86_06335, partial [Arachidicoccus soli]|nr:hypothetical protein [Arachidicoccus soli]
MNYRINKKLLFLILFFFALSIFRLNAQEQYADKVNTMVGTEASGNTYPGATYPFGMVQFTRSY